MAALNPFGMLQKTILNAALAAQKASSAQQSTQGRTPSGGGTSAASSPSGGGYTPLGTNTDEEIRNKSPESWAVIQQAKADYDRAKAQGDAAGMQQAHQVAEDVRSMFGYSGGKDGSEYFATSVQNQSQALYNDAIAALNRAAAAQQAATQAAVDRYVASLNAQIPGINQNAADANAGAYRNYLRATNPFGAGAQQQAVLGLQNSGFSESSLADLGNVYQSVVGQNERARQDYLNQLDLAKQEAAFTGDVEKAGQLAEYAKLIAGQRFDQGASLLENAIAENNLAFQREQWEYEMGQEERSQLEYLAALLAQYGIFDRYRALGLSSEQVAAMEAYWRAMRAQGV